MRNFIHVWKPDLTPAQLPGVFNSIERRIATLHETAPLYLDVADIDGDNDLDVAASFGRGLSWFENLGVPGDVNRDGRFDSSDLLSVFQVGEYEDEAVGNSSFEDGDWNGDGEFTSADLVLVFQQGGYVGGPPRI